VNFSCALFAYYIIYIDRFPEKFRLFREIFLFRKSVPFRNKLRKNWRKQFKSYGNPSEKRVFFKEGSVSGMPRKPKEPADGRPLRFDTIKVRLFPTAEQAGLFEKTFGCCRYVWNQMLSDQERFYLETGKHFIPTPAKYKNAAPFLKEVDNQALTQEHNKLAQAFRVFWSNPAAFGHPRYKRKKDDRDSFTVCNHKVYPTVYTTKDGIRMTKAGIVKAAFPRRPRNGWKLKRITVEKTKSGKYYCFILYEYPAQEPEPVVPASETTIGLKYSMAHFYVDSEGHGADPPHWLRESQEKLVKLQRRLNRMEPGSKNYRETVQKYRELHEHIANQRRDFLHKESRRIANAWDAVCVRDDDLGALADVVVQGNVMESGFGMFREMLRYKLARQGKFLIEVDRYYPTSRTCHRCGYQLTEAVSCRRRTWTCLKCGAVLNREVNAARNIKAQGLTQFDRYRAVS